MYTYIFKRCSLLHTSQSSPLAIHRLPYKNYVDDNNVYAGNNDIISFLTYPKPWNQMSLNERDWYFYCLFMLFMRICSFFFMFFLVSLYLFMIIIWFI